MLRLSALLLASLPLTAAPAVAADDSPKDVIAKAIKAHGGEEFLAKHVAVQSRDKGKLDLPGVGEVEFAQETSYMLPDKFKSVIDMEVMKQKLKLVSTVNGDKIAVAMTLEGKEIDAGEGVKEAFKDLHHIVKVGHLAPLLTEKGFAFEAFGEEKVDGKTAVGVRVTAKGHRDVTLFFDKETSLLVRMDFRTKEPTNGNEVSEERVMSGYAKNKQGVPVPKKVVIKHDGKLFLESETLEVTYLEKLDASEFKK